ncbi:MAG: hypothetical protein MJ203_03395 [archaeon]|nr:hypothetical protein [archaeon]
MEKNFKDYKSQEELERYIEKRSNDMVKGPLEKINKKEKELSKRIKLKEKENEAKANAKLKEEGNRIKEKLRWYNKTKL